MSALCQRICQVSPDPETLLREWGESNHHGYPERHPPADLKSVKPTGTHPLPDILSRWSIISSNIYFEKVII